MAKEKLYSPQQVLVATLVGGPAAGVYTLISNSNSVEGGERALPIVIAGWASVAIYLALLPFVPFLLAVTAFPALYCWTAYYIAKKGDFPRQIMKQGKLYRHHTMTTALLVGAASLTATAIVEAIWIGVLQH